MSDNRSDRYDSPHTGLPSFSRHEDSAAFGPHIEGSVERRWIKGTPDVAFWGAFFITLGGSDPTGYASFNGHASAEWLREAAAVFMDTADAVDKANEADQ